MISLIVAAMVMVVAASVLMGVSVRVQANAQKNITNIMELNAQNINNTLDSQRLLVDRAMLHKANNTDTLMNGNDLLHCIQSLLVNIKTRLSLAIVMA